MPPVLGWGVPTKRIRKSVEWRFRGTQTTMLTGGVRGANMTLDSEGENPETCSAENSLKRIFALVWKGVCKVWQD